MENHENATKWDFSSDNLPYYDQLYKTALRMTRSVHDTEDLLQYGKRYNYITKPPSRMRDSSIDVNRVLGCERLAS